MKTLTEKKEWIQYAPEIGDEIDENYRTITVKNGIGFHLTGRISEADAKLMAAAPDLLEELQKTVKELRFALENHCALLKIPKSTIDDNSVIIAAEAAIKKATT